MFSSFYLPLTGEDKKYYGIVNLTMYKAPLKMLVKNFFSFKQKQAEKRKHVGTCTIWVLHQIVVTKINCETVKIQNIFRYMGKKVYKDRAVINNNCYRIIVNSQVKCYFEMTVHPQI